MMRLFYQATGFLTAIAILASAAQAQEDEFRDPIVRGLSFQGNHAIDDRTLRISIGTSESAWFARFPLVSWLGLGEKKYFNDTEFRRDVERIKALYRASGFWNVRVDTLVRRNDGDMNIRFVIDEGEPIRVTAIEVVGAEPILRERELVDLPLREGDPFNRLRLRASADTIRSLLRDRGYPFAQVFRRFDQHPEEHRADVSFEVVPGVRAVVDSVEVVGADRIGEDVVRRMISIRPGDLFRERDLYESQLGLYRLGAYNYVGVGLADTVPRVGDDSLVAVRVRLSEGPLRRVRLGLGYGTIDCFRTLTSWTVHNFLGGGRTLRLDGRLSKIGTGPPLSAEFQRSVCPQLAPEPAPRLALNYNVTAGLREPYLFSRRTSGRLSLFVEKHSEFNAYLRESSGGDVAMTYYTPWNIPITLAYSLVYGSTQADEATYCSELGLCTADERKFLTEANYRSTVSLALLRDRTDSPFFPTRGSVLTAQVRFSSGQIGTDERGGFAKGVIDFVSFHPVGRRAVFAWRVRAGTILPPKVTLQAQDVQFVPPEERFYGGGANTVRGFGQNELGPLVWVLDSRAGRDLLGRDEIPADSTFIGVDDTTYVGDLRSAPTGGNDLFLVNMELRFPLPGFAGRVSGGVFVDVGQIFRRQEGELFVFPELRITPGAGLRYASPLGPIRLDVGFNPGDPQEGDLLLDADPPEDPPDQPRKLVLLKENFQPKPGFLGHFQIHFSIGQAF